MPVSLAAKKDGLRRRRLLVALTGGAVAAFVFAIYLSTLAPTVLFYDRPLLLDAAMLQTQAIVLGIAGGTGSPTWLMLTHLFTYLPFGDPAYRTNLASAVYSTGAVLAVFAAGYLLSRRVLAAAVAALAFGLGTTFWSVAVIAEIYNLNALLILLPLISLLLWRERRRDRYLLLAAFLCGFAMTNHLTSGLVAPGAALFVAIVDWRKLLRWRLVLGAAALFLLGFVPYVYLPIRASMNPPMNEWNPDSFDRFWTLVSGGDHQNLLWAFGPAEIPGRLALYGSFLLQNYNLVLLMLAVAGFVALLLRDRAVALLTGFLYFGWVFHAIEYNIFDVNLYFITSYIVLALWMAVGIGVVLETLEAARLPEGVRGAVLVVASLALLLLPLYGLPERYERNDMSEAYRGRENIEAVVEHAERGATILHHRSELWYMVLVEKRRRDLTLADPWFPGRQRYTDIVWPDDIDYITTNLRWGTNDYTGVSTAQEAADRGAVYILEQDSAGPHNFYDAGFRTVRVEGHLFELVPPGREPYTQR